MPRPLTHNKIYHTRAGRPLSGAELLLAQGFSPATRIMNDDGTIVLSNQELHYLSGDTMHVPVFGMLLFNVLGSILFGVPEVNRGHDQWHENRPPSVATIASTLLPPTVELKPAQKSKLNTIRQELIRNVRTRR